MYKVTVENACRCFLRDGMSESQEFPTKEEAKEEATSMFERMNQNFCKKHSFEINERFGDYTIVIKDEKR